MTKQSDHYQGFLSGIGVKSGREAVILVFVVLLVGMVALYALILLANSPQELADANLNPPLVQTPSSPNVQSQETDASPASQARIAYESGRTAEFSGDHPRAYEAYRQAIANFKEPDETPIDLYVERMRALARMARATGRLEEAEQVLKQTIELVGKSDREGLNSPTTLTASLTGELANIALKRQNYVAAANYAREVVNAARPDATSKASPNEQAIAVTIAALDTLSQAQDASGNLPDAIAAAEQALTLTKRSVGPLSPSVGLRLERLAVFYEKFDKPLDGLALRGQALAIAEVDLNIDRDELTINLNNLAEAYRRYGEFELAKPLYKKAIGIAKSTRGPRAAETAVPLNNLGLLAQWSGNKEEAEDYYMQALSIIWETMGPDHDVTQRVLANVVRLLEAQGRVQDISALRTKYGPDQ